MIEKSVENLRKEKLKFETEKKKRKEEELKEGQRKR